MKFTTADLPLSVQSSHYQRLEVHRLLSADELKYMSPGGQCERAFVCYLYDLRGRQAGDLFFTPAFLVQMHDLLGRICQLEERPIKLEVVQNFPAIELPRQSPELKPIDELDEIALIKRRMMEGR